MSFANEHSHNAENLLFDREDLATDIELILKGSPYAPDVLARLFVTFRRAIDSGLQGINYTRDALVIAVEIAYLHSSSHVAALRLYKLSQEGELKIEDEPVRLINAAIERNTAGGRDCISKGRRRKGEKLI